LCAQNSQKNTGLQPCVWFFFAKRKKKECCLFLSLTAAPIFFFKRVFSLLTCEVVKKTFKNKKKEMKKVYLRSDSKNQLHKLSAA